jgi:L-seryl-tRNA(Ser) seleniumtransferase
MKKERTNPGLEAINLEMRKLPQVEVLLSDSELGASIRRYSRPLVAEAINNTLSSARESIASGMKAPSPEKLVELIKDNLDTNWPGFGSEVINATGVILHTNLGRAPLPTAALESIKRLCGGFSALEYEHKTGKRGRRALELERLLCMLTGAEDALVVNNNAAAVLLVLVAMAHRREAIVSRGELVQIGGGFRVPEIMEQSGVSLREIGTTNQTYLDDYEKAINENTGLLLKFHRSNFTISGFTNEVSIAELAQLGKIHKIPVVYDIGSGAFFDTREYGMEHEPTIHDAIKEGADIICFSGDKLFGAAQAGVIVGKKEHIAKMRSHQLLRAIRIDKIAAAALEATTLLYLNKEANQQVPIWQMMGASPETIAVRAEALATKIRKSGISAEVKSGLSMVGGGSLPDQSLPTILLVVEPEISLEAFSSRLRMGTPPVIGRIEDGCYIFDLRTVFPEQEEILLQKILKYARRQEC